MLCCVFQDVRECLDVAELVDLNANAREKLNKLRTKRILSLESVRTEMEVCCCCSCSCDRFVFGVVGSVVGGGVVGCCVIARFICWRWWC